MTTKLTLPFKKKVLLEDHFLKYKVLLGNKLRFTNFNTYETITGLNFSGNTLIDLEKTIISLKRALTFIEQIKNNKGVILFVGTRHDLKGLVEEVGSKAKAPYVNDRWLKGLLTNWENASNSIKFYNLFLRKLGLRNKRKNKVISTFFGLRSLTKLPDAIFIFDVATDLDALKEARLLNIPVIAIADTNAPLDLIDYPILGNSGSILPIAFFSNLIISVFKK